jgi:hypothetical protein
MHRTHKKQIAKQIFVQEPKAKWQGSSGKGKGKLIFLNI